MGRRRQTNENAYSFPCHYGAFSLKTTLRIFLSELKRILSPSSFVWNISFNSYQHEWNWEQYEWRVNRGLHILYHIQYKYVYMRTIFYTKYYIRIYTCTPAYTIDGKAFAHIHRNLDGFVSRGSNVISVCIRRTRA